MKVIAERLDGNRIIVRAPSSSSDKIKKIPGCAPRWRRGIQKDTFLGWSFPLTMDTCRDLTRMFGKDNVKFGPLLSEWGKKEQELEKLLRDIKADTPENNLENMRPVKWAAPYLWEAMAARPLQATAALYMGVGRQVLNSSQPGVGKTLETLAALVQGTARTILIFARKTALTTVWEREIYRWLGPDLATVYVADGSRDNRASAIQAFSLSIGLPLGSHPPMSFLICNSEMARTAKACQNGRSAVQCRKMCESHGKSKAKYHPEPAWPQLFGLPPLDAIVLDESHRAITGLGSRSLLVTQVHYGMSRLPRRPDTMMLPLSGTPWRADRVQAWGTWNWMRPDLFSSRWTWIQRYFETADGTHDEMVIGDLRPGKVKAFDREVSRWSVRHTKAEAAPDMPAKEYAGSLLDPADRDSPVGVWLEMTPEQAEAYGQMKANGDADILGGRLTTASALAEITRLRQFACSFGRLEGDQFVPDLPSNKLNWLLDLLDEADGQGKVIVASQFTKLIHLFAGELEKQGHRVLTLTGRGTARDREEVQDLFQNDDSCNLILVNTLAGGESINLSRASYMVFTDETFIPDEQEQMEDRGHRIGYPTGLTVYYLRSLGTIEVDIATGSGLKDGRVKARLDGARGLSIRRKIVTPG